MKKPCNNPECCCTTNIADMIEHGWGECDFNGFWEHRCVICNSFFEKNIIEDQDIITKVLPFLVANYKICKINEFVYIYTRSFDNYPSDRRILELTAPNKCILKKFPRY